MNAPNPANAVFRAVRAVAEQSAPEFTRKLSYDEQRKLSDAEWRRYVDWLFAHNSPTSIRWARRERGEDNINRDSAIDRNTANADGWGWSE